MFDQQISYHRLPKSLLAKLPGYNAFRKRGIEFTDFYTNRNACSPSRAVHVSGTVNTGISDDITFAGQNDNIPYLNENIDTYAKELQKKDYLTGFYGKQHFDARLGKGDYIRPYWGDNTRESMKVYGYDIFNSWGEAGANQRGVYLDAVYFNFQMPPLSTEYDYMNDKGEKFTGILPFLKARAEDGKQFLVEFHPTNPHDIHDTAMNLAQQYGEEPPSTQFNQFYLPYMKDQLIDLGISTNPYFYNKLFTDAFIKHPNLTENFFESNYIDYKSNPESLLYSNSYLNDNCFDPKYNSIYPIYPGFNYWFQAFSANGDQNDVLPWKNLSNAYYGLVIEADSYLFKLYQELETLGLFETTTVIITSDHGEHLAEHGQRAKGLPFESSNNIPLIITSPDIPIALRGNKSSIIGSAIDIAPTVLEISGSSANKPQQFRGNPLLVRNSVGELVPNVELVSNNNALYIFNNIQMLFSYYYFKQWYQNIATDKQKKNVISNPLNIFDIQLNFVHVVTKFAGNKYKFGRIYSLAQLLFYNTKGRIFNKLSFLKNISINPNPIYIQITNKLNEVLPAEFSSKELVDILYSTFGSQDNKYLYSSIMSVFELIKVNQDNILNLYIPGTYENFSTNFNSGQLMYCYNLTNDPDEIVNLLDPKNYNSSNDIIFESLNTELNTTLIEKNASPLITIVPFDVFYNCLVGFINSLNDNLDGALATDSKAVLEKLTFLAQYTTSEHVGNYIYKDTFGTDSYLTYKL